ncbi:MAG TPA: inosine-5-monophosphate dehydrogenase [Cytophagales bacterium]|jgi:CBS domain-containing protein|nr:inosine-5-monophosphate dehydrogenase [Cytophagales bacterium]
MNFTPKMEMKTREQEKRKYEPVTRYMATDLITFSPEDEIGFVIDKLMKNKISGAPVLNDKDELVGLISEQDCLRVIIDSVYYNQPISKHRVKDYMTTHIKSVSVTEDVVDVANKFLSNRFRRFPVVDEKGRLLGQVSKRDILKAAQSMNITTW